MTTPGRLLGLGVALLCLTPRIKYVNSFISCPSRTCVGPASLSHDNPLRSCSSCPRNGYSIGTGCRSPGAVDSAMRETRTHPSTPMDQIVEGDDTDKIDQAADVMRPKPAWVEDPNESRVKSLMRSAARQRDHDRIIMYLHKYRDGLACKRELVDVVVYNTALRALEECHRWRLALGILRDMQKDGVAPDRNSYFFVISACSRRGEARTALNLLAEMRRGQANGGPMLDLLLYGVAIKACAGGGYWRQALGLLEEMESAGVQPNVVVVNTVLTACAKCGQTSRATELLKEMKVMHGVEPNARSYNSIISGHERVGEWREALSLAQIMERVEGVSPTVVTFNSVIGACKRASKPAEALAVLGLMRRKGLKPDVISFNSAISACSSGGMWKSALQLLETMPSEGVKPDLTTYNAALDVCAKSGQWEMALSLFEELCTGDNPALVPDLYTYNTVMTVFSRSGMLRRALGLLEEAKARGLSPDVVTYSLSDFRDAINSHGREARSSILFLMGTLVRACERAVPPQPEVAIRLISDMKAAHVPPNNTTFVSVALSLGRSGRALESLNVLKTMRRWGTPPDAICCQTVLRVLDRWNRPEEALALFEDMKTQGLARAPEVAEEAYCCGIRALEKLGRWQEAVSLLEEWRALDEMTDDSSDPQKDDKYDQWYRALNLLAGGGLSPDTDAKTARAAMVAAARGGLAEEALAIMENMEDLGFELGAMEYGAAMEAFEQSCKPERSLEIFDDMLANGVEPDVLCFASATRCSRVAGDWDTAIRLVTTALQKGLLPNSRTFEATARLCAQAGRFQELWGLKEFMRELVIEGGLARPGSSIYISVMRACGAADRPDLVLRCLSEMSNEDAPSKDWRTRALDDPATLSAAVGALSMCNRTAEADVIYANAIARNILPDPASGGTWTAAGARINAARVRAIEAGVKMEELLEMERMGMVNTGEGEGEQGKLLLWVDVRRAPVEIVSAVVRRVIEALNSVGSVSDGLVIEWGGGRWTKDDDGSSIRWAARGGGPSGRSASRLGRRGQILAAFALVEPALEVTEPRRRRGQVHVEREELHRWLQEARRRR